MYLIITEKRTAGEKVASCIAGERFTSGQGYLKGKDYYITWCVGHLYELFSLEEYRDDYDPEQKYRWTMDGLPFIPEGRKFRYRKKNSPKTPSMNKTVNQQVKVIKALANDSSVEAIYHCGDSDREGEVIVRNVLQALLMRRSRRTETEEECSRRHQVKAMSVNPMRLDDLGTLVTIRKGHMTGQRELFLHHYRNTLARCGIYGQKQEQKIREMNSQFTEPLPEYEIKNILKQYKLYMAKNETIIRDLAITPAEQTMMRTIYGPEEKERRRLQKNKCGMSGEERIKSTCAKIMKYLALGKSNSEIAALLSCTTRTVRNYIHKFDLLGKGAAFCAGKISDIVTPEEPYQDTDENNKAVESAAKTYTNDVVDDMKRKAGKANKPKPRKLNKKEKASLVSKILTLLESQIPDFWAKIQKVADDFFKERDARLLIKTEGKKNRYTKLFRRLLLGSVPGYYVPNHTNGLVQAFMEALYAA